MKPETISELQCAIICEFVPANQRVSPKTKLMKLKQFGPIEA